MTSIRGSKILQATCCGRCYRFPHYASVNFSAREYWTDGWRESSLMPNDEGLRRCICGRFLLVKSLVLIATVEQANLPQMERVSPEELPQCIAQATQIDVEIAARLEYWRHLNHPYRELYRQHRDKEEADTQARWEAERATKLSIWFGLHRRSGLVYQRPPNAPLTYPPFHPTDEQVSNMERLSELLSD